MSKSTPTRFATCAFGALLGAALAGCGSDGSPAEDFVGAWHYRDVKSTVQCLNADPLDQPPQPNKTFAHGATSPLVDLSPSPLGLDASVVCNFAFDVGGSVATVEAAQTCAINSVDTLTIDNDDATSKPAWTFSLTSSTTAEEVVKGTIHITLPPASTGGMSTSQTCSWSLIGHLDRVSKD